MTNWKRSRNADSDDETSEKSRAQTADTASSSAAVRDGSFKPLAAAALEQDAAKMETHLEAASFDHSAGAVELADSAAPRLFGRDEAQIQRSLEGTNTAIDEVPSKVLDVLSNGGQPLDQPVQRALEGRMDADFSDVRLHTGGTAAKAAEAIDAKAFTCGNDIVFNSGEYDPESPEGQHLLAHELAYVKQQNGGAPISMMPKEGADLEIDPDPQLEREADAAAEQALSGEEPLVVNRMGTDVHIQRMPEAETLSKARQQASERLGSKEDDRVPADLEALAEEVERLKDGQATIMETLAEAKPGAASEGNWLTAATKGTVGALAGAGAGAAVGSVVPVIGTATGAAVGAAVSGLASDVTKEGVDYLVDNRPDGKGAELERMYDEMRTMYEELKGEQYTHGGPAKF